MHTISAAGLTIKHLSVRGSGYYGGPALYAHLMASALASPEALGIRQLRALSCFNFEGEVLAMLEREQADIYHLRCGMSDADIARDVVNILQGKLATVTLCQRETETSAEQQALQTACVSYGIRLDTRQQATIWEL